jgi:hypothetical protein
MKRRDFLKLSGAAIVVGGAGGASLFKPVATVAESATIQLDIVEADHEMVDGVFVKGWAYKSNLAVGGVSLGARIPGPTIFVNEGERLHIRVRNKIPDSAVPHSFDIPGVQGAYTGPLAEDEEFFLEFDAPAAGTYLYHDSLNAPVNRVMGLHGALVVLPPAVGHRTPYTSPTLPIRKLFDDLGTTAHFPGHFWDRDRNAVWVFATVDPFKHEAAFNSRTAPLAPSAFTTGYLPQYFMINGKSGFFAAQHGGHAEPPPGGGHGEHGAGNSPDAQGNISIHGYVGEPCLIRNLNAGMMIQSPHIHGNHVYLLSENGALQDNLFMVDTWTMPPLACKDVLLPYIKPPDIPGGQWLRFEARARNPSLPPEQQLPDAQLSEELFPLFYPMHDHNEISNTAAGANYPFGCATHFQFDGPVRAHHEVIQIDRAELRLRTGELTLSGRSSGVALRASEGMAAHSVLMVHAGPTAAGPSIGTFTPAADGTWSFRGRALKALGSRVVTIHNHETGAERAAIPLTLR